MSGGNDRTVRLWNPRSGQQIASFTGHSYEVLDVSISFDNARFSSCGKEKTILLWDVETASNGATRRIRGHDQTINAVAFNETATLLLSGSEDRTVKIWDLASRGYEPLQVLSEAADSITSVLVKGHEIFTGWVPDLMLVV